ncbi:hypothetical protein BH09PAT3_BH09PAT3_1890 [soil metagenome]
MEALVEQPKQEQLKSFDVLASVDMLQFDLQRFGQILPETRQRVLDEELSYLTEGINRASRTSFALKRDEYGSLTYFDEGDWRPYSGMLRTGLEVARAEATKDPRRQFLAEWAERDEDMGYRMRSLKPGETLSWSNPYPHDIAKKYGTAFMKSCGLQPEREMGFMYQAICHENGSVELQSQTIDRSDPDGYAATEKSLQYDKDLDLDGMVRSYDGALRQKYGGHFYAGRRDAEIQENVWHAVKQQEDLIQHFIEGIESIATQNYDRDQLERMAKLHTYKVWATFEKRLTDPKAGTETKQQLQYELDANFRLFVNQGRALVGCGGDSSVLQGEEAMLALSGEDAVDAIFGKNERGSEAYSFNKLMFCVVCQAPPEEQAGKKMCGPCGICKTCDTRIQVKGVAKAAMSAS